jgi:hypothetical protein
MALSEGGPKVVTRQLQAMTLAMCMNCGFTEDRCAPVKGGPVPFGTSSQHAIEMWRDHGEVHEVREVSMSLKSVRMEGVEAPAPAPDLAADPVLQTILRRIHQVAAPPELTTGALSA